MLLEQQRFRGYCADSARTDKIFDGYEQVNCEEQEIAHELHVITSAYPELTLIGIAMSKGRFSKFISAGLDPERPLKRPS